VTSQGSALARFRRAVASGNPSLALAAAAELPRLGLEDALALVLVLEDEARHPSRDRSVESGVVVRQQQDEGERVLKSDLRQLGGGGHGQRRVAGGERRAEAAVGGALGGHGNECSHGE
jgi:hypothetical protein